MNTLYAFSPEQEIIDRIRNGQTALFEVLIRRYNEVLYKIARSYGFNHQEAQDLLQDTHLAAYQNLAGFEGRSSYKTWIARIMVNKCLYKLSYGNRKYETRQVVDENAEPMFTSHQLDTEAEVLNRELSRILEKTLEGVPVHLRMVFILREVEGFSVAETAEMLNLSKVNVKVRLNRAKSMLQQELEKFYPKAQLYQFNRIYCDAVAAYVLKVIHTY